MIRSLFSILGGLAIVFVLAPVNAVAEDGLDSFGQNNSRAVLFSSEVRALPKKPLLVSFKNIGDAASDAVSYNSTLADWLPIHAPDCVEMPRDKLEGELLSCLRDHGFALVEFDDTGNIVIIYPGRVFHIEKIIPAQNSDAVVLGSELLTALYKPGAGSLFSSSELQNYVRILEDRGLLDTVSLEFFINEQDGLEVTVSGTIPNNNVAASILTGIDSQLMGQISGRHNIHYPAPGHLKYSIAVNDEGRFDTVGVSVPLYQDSRFEVRGKIEQSETDFQLFQNRSKRLILIAENGVFNASGKVGKHSLALVYENQKTFDVTAPEYQESSDLVSVAWAYSWRDDARPWLKPQISMTLSKPESQTPYVSLSSSAEIMPLLDLPFDFQPVMRANLSAIVEDTESLGLQERLYLGGMSSLRGYKFNSIGTEYSRDGETGGNIGTTLQMEIGRMTNIMKTPVMLGMHYDVGRLKQIEGWTSTFDSIGVFGRFRVSSYSNLEFSISHPFDVNDNLSADLSLKLDF